MTWGQTAAQVSENFKVSKCMQKETHVSWSSKNHESGRGKGEALEKLVYEGGRGTRTSTRVSND